MDATVNPPPLGPRREARVYAINLPHEGDPDRQPIHVPRKYGGEGMQAHIDRTLAAYRAPQGDQAHRYQAVTEGAYFFAQMLVDLCPPSPELMLALRHVEDARMRANQSIAVNEGREG